MPCLFTQVRSIWVPSNTTFGGVVLLGVAVAAAVPCSCTAVLLGLCASSAGTWLLLRGAVALETRWLGLEEVEDRDAVLCWPSGLLSGSAYLGTLLLRGAIVGLLRLAG